ncbi:small RNA 2'-o-methyltransferase-like [Plakobranchus ocellatus]|uniref:Small RNA 2'-O-methyltransferase n=1 Tax=Plakobranchus ocellatus TaxID=259542 RepID=A0AAV3ZXG7_9GAST|nr:small RNA 2'-o-methyltransferase-like [Plakobranchus ocellatus]
MGDTDFKTEEASAGIQFFPPLYTQRYALASQLLMQHNIQSVVDFGCSECGFLKLLPTVSCVEKAALVDIDRSLLVAKRRSIDPEVHHFVQKRLKPLHVSLYCGSAEHMDRRIDGFEAATLIEVIEHLHPETLAGVTENVFGCLQPRLCFVTTPNSEFNVLFKNKDPTQFRHWDHKFEWTRLQFGRWCEQVCSRFGYNVKYTGVGEIISDPDSARLGPCTQAAVFTVRAPSATWKGYQDSQLSQEKSGQREPGEVYELIAESEFPYLRDDYSQEEKIDLEVAFCLRELVRNGRLNVPYGEDLSIHVSKIAEFRCVKALTDIDGVRRSLERQQFALMPDKNHVLIPEQDSSSEDELQEESPSLSASEDGIQDKPVGRGCSTDTPRPATVLACVGEESRARYSKLEDEKSWDDAG